MTGIFNKAFGGGVAIGNNLANNIKQFQRESQLEKLADLARGGLGNQQNANELGAGLIALGQVNAGINAQNVPYQREQQQLQREFQNQNALANQAFRQQQFEAQQAQNAFQNNIAQQRLGLAQQQAERVAQGGNNFTTPFEAVDENGNRVFLQADSQGNVKPIEGFSPKSAKGVKVDRGTYIEIVNPSTGEIISRTRKENQQAEFDKSFGRTTGKTAAEDRADLSRLTQETTNTVNIIDAILLDPNLENAVGNIDGRAPDLIAGQGVVDFRAKAAQLQGKTFLQAFESLKGGGQITEIEGIKAENAMARLSQTQSAEAYRQSLLELKKIVENGLERARKKATAPRITSDTISNQSQGRVTEVPQNEIDDLVRKYTQ